MSYWGYYGMGTRRGDDCDYFTCSCADECHLSEGVTCGCCENISCSDCLTTVCDICEERERRGDPKYEIFSTSICFDCIASPGCKSCNDITICKDCISDHLKTCTEKSRAERRASTTNHEANMRRQVEAQIDAALDAAFERSKSVVENDTKDKDWLSDHLQTSSQKTRTEQVVTFINQEIAALETEICLERAEIKSKQASLRQLEADLAAAQERKSNAEKEAKNEGSSPKKARNK